MPLNRELAFATGQSAQGEINAVENEADTEYREDHHQGHDLVGKEGEDALLDEEPIVTPVVDSVAKACPDKDHQNAHKFFPDFAQIVFYIAIGQIQHTPAEQKAVVHKGLKDHIGKWRLATQSCTGITHPHGAGGNGQGDHRLADFGEFGIELDKGHKHRHDGADVEGELIGADAVVAIGQGHDKKVDNVKAYGQICHDFLQFLLLTGELSADQRQCQSAAEDHKQVQKMPHIKKSDGEGGVVLAEQPGKKFFHILLSVFPGGNPVTKIIIPYIRDSVF